MKKEPHAKGPAPVKKSRKKDGSRHSGFVAIIGRPNVGKSTLLNYLVGQKIAGVSPKPQTTRHCVRGIVTQPEGQILFLDTPGMHDPRDPLGAWMMKDMDKMIQDVDLFYWLVLPDEFHPYDENILAMIKAKNVPTILVVNQIDKYAKLEILPVLDYYNKQYAFKELIPISAKRGEQVDTLIWKTFDHLPEGEPFFPEDQVSDQSERFIVSEMIREKVFRFTEKEVPYGTAVVIDVFKERTKTLIDIEATIYVERESQKAILIGKGGQMMKEIGQAARVDIERLVGNKVFLKLWVKTMEDWKENPAALRKLGYE